jgi:peptidylprolyl isomerase
MEKAKMWDLVKIHYTGYRKDKSIFDSTTAREPLSVQVGGEVLIQGLEEAIPGMKPGEVKRVEVKPEDGYGLVDPELFFKVKKKEVFGDLEVKVGQVIELPNDDVGVLLLKVVEVGDVWVKLDGNHELAGEPLTFDLELIEILSNGFDDEEMEHELDMDMEPDEDFDMEDSGEFD